MGVFTHIRGSIIQYYAAININNNEFLEDKTLFEEVIEEAENRTKLLELLVRQRHADPVAPPVQ